MIFYKNTTFNAVKTDYMAGRASASRSRCNASFLNRHEFEGVNS